PNRFSTGTAQSFSRISTDGDDLCPILSSCRPTRNPENPGSTKNAEIPFLPAAGSVFANTRSTPAALPFVTQVFVPFNLYTFPSRIARACIPAASDPAAGSVRQNAPSVSPVAMRRKYFFFCAPLPNSISGACTAEFVTLIAVDIAVNTRATSSSINANETVSSPGPPHSSGTSIPQQPISPSFLIASSGNFSAFSHSLTNGRTSASINWRTVSRISLWWSLSEKSIVSVDRYAVALKKVRGRTRNANTRHAFRVGSPLESSG